MTQDREHRDLPARRHEAFLPYHCGPLRGLCSDGYQSFDLTEIPWDELKGRSEPALRLTKSSRTRCVVRMEFAPPSQPPRVVYAKRVLVADWRKRLGCLFVPSKAQYEWTAGYRLPTLGLATARPVVCAERWRGPWLCENYLVTEEIAGARPLRVELAQIPQRSQRCDLLRLLAEWLWQVHQRGFYHDDCSTQHVFVEPSAPGSQNQALRFWFIDLDNCRFHRATVPWRRRVKNLFQLLRSIPPRWASRSDRLYFVRSYLSASGESQRLRRAVVRMRCLARWKEADIHL